MYRSSGLSRTPGNGSASRWRPCSQSLDRVEIIEFATCPIVYPILAGGRKSDFLQPSQSNPVEWRGIFARGRRVPVVNGGVFPELKSRFFRCGAAAGIFLFAMPCHAQDIEPRRWSHLPIGSNFLGAGYAYTEGEIFLNPVLRIEDGEFDLNTTAVKYIHSFELLGKSARVDITQPYQTGTWSGLLDGVPTSVDRGGWSDGLLRLAVNLIGAPPLAGREFAQYNAATECETIVGVGLLLQVPTGEYLEDKLINLGTNRFTITPQFGVVHNRGKWSAEFSGSASFYTENDEYFNGNTLEEDVYFVGQGHLSYTFFPGLWLSAGVRPATARATSAGD